MRERNEKTSKAVASKAGLLLADIDVAVAELARCQNAISCAIVLLKKSKSVAASALTQKEKPKPRRFRGKM